MSILNKIIVILGFAIIGLVLGMTWARHSDMATGQGLAGGAIVFGYGIIGAVTVSLIGVITSLRLSPLALRRTSAIFALVLVLVSVYTVIRFQSYKQATLDPPEAYDGIPVFTASIERTKFADPVLAKQLTVNSQERQWTSLLPDKRICSGKASATALRKVSNAIIAFVIETGGHVNCSGEIEQVFRWNLLTDAAGSRGVVEYNEVCLNTTPALQFVLFTVAQASTQSSSRVTCQ